MRRSRPILLLTVVALLASLGAAPAIAAPAADTTFTILHTNDFHGNLQLSGSNPGAARVAQKIADVRTAVGADKVLAFDAGDMMQGSLISNLQKGLPTIDYYRTIGFDAATFGNHEFDWGQAVLADRIAQAESPATADETPMEMISANVTKKDAGGACTWEPLNASVTPYEVFTVGTAPNEVKVGVIGVGSVETPYITIAEATAGLCFRDPAESILHYYDAVDAASDVIVILSHNGYTDGGYGYGFTVYGDQTLAQKLIDAGKPANLIIGGHSHTDLTSAKMIGQTAVVQAHYAGRKVGRADITVTAAGAVSVNWSRIVVGTADPEYAPVKAMVDGYANDPAYQALINQPIGYTKVDLLRNYNGDSMMGDFVDDAIYGALNGDADATNDVDMFFNNAGGIRIDWCDTEDPESPGSYIWSSNAADCQAEGVWSHDPMLLTYGHMFQILPFGNATAVGTMTGAQVLQLLNQSATLFKGAIQPSGIRYSFYRYQDAGSTYAWGAFDVKVYNRSAAAWQPLDLAKTYNVGTNEFLAPAGQDGYTPFKYLKNITYWGDMLNAVNAYVSATYTIDNPYRGPDGDGTLDGRIARDGTDAPDSGTIRPVTILHNNDSHGNLAKGTYVGYTQLASLIKQEQAKNPGRTILLNAGDQIQGDAMMYYFKTSYSGAASDGTPLPDSLKTNPMMAVMNALGYDAMTLGNHEFNFGSDVFKGVFAQAGFPVLGANVADTGAYGLGMASGGEGVKPYVEFTLDGIKVAVLGITNHRVPNYELPSNIPGLTFSNPIDTAAAYTPGLWAKDDVVVALTHIGFTEDPKSVEVDANVDTNFAAQVPGVDAVIGGHSHTNPVTGYGDYKFLPTIVAGPDDGPVIINQAYRYNNYLGQVVLGVVPKMQLTVADVQSFWASKAINNAGVRKALLAKLRAADRYFDAGNTAMALKTLRAFINSVKAQAGKHITKAAAQVLIADAKWMIANKGASRTVASAGQYLAVTKDTPEDPEIKAIVDPYVAQLTSYYDKVVGQTTAPIDTLNAFTEETNGANLQADAAVYELAKNGITDVDIHLSGAMTNKLIAVGATPAVPVTLKVSDMFAAMPYENSLVVLSMNGPQIKAVLERAYRNYYYYKYVPGYGGYSHYTTCMIDTNDVGQITYDDTYPSLPDGSNVVSLTIDGVPVDFGDASTYYNVSTVNYVAAGSCNFNDGGVSLWPLGQIVHDTQFYVRDAVIDYITHEGIVSPAIEGRLVFN